jgi:hypothetical protein
MSTEYNKDTYIGYLKMKKGGMKIIPGDKDEKIINKRNKILNHLEQVLSGGKKLKEEYIGSYFKALGGKYVRNDMCTGGDNRNCKDGKLISLGGAHKLLKLAARKNFPMDEILTKFKGSAPSLYESLENKISGIKGGNRERELSAVRSRSYEGDYEQYGGTLNDFRNEIGRTTFDVELNKLRDEINLIRNS